MSETVRFSSPIAYEGNLFFLILALIFWLPLGLLLLMRYGYFVHKASRFHFKYRACWGWLYFWGIFFFPIAIILLVVKGVDLVEEAHSEAS